MQINTPVRLILFAFMMVGLTACAATAPTKTASAQLDAAGFDQWKSDFTQRALQQGYAPQSLQAVMGTVQFQPKLVEFDRKQPESQLTLQQYIERTVSTDRINKGRNHMAENRDVLNRIASQSGVPASVIVALWGKESSYGAFTGGYKVGDALATMSYEGRRRAMFEKELLAFITVTEKLQKDPQILKGSWAGAMGQCQFMPSSYLRYAADGDGDGKADIWFSKPDVFASAANFLKQSGWQAGQPIAQSVHLPANINPAALGRDKQPRPLRDWINGGVKIIGKTPADLNYPAKLYAPDGVNGPAFVLYSNFDVLLRWNNSGYFGVGISLLSDQLSTP
jgi:membrane-bound lytic murein transglycosylase B